jgi:hypothetical protein
VNDSGIALALLNWSDTLQPPFGSKRQSRGLVIPSLIASRSFAEVQTSLGLLDRQGMFPFRLVGVFPAERALWEWCGTSNKLESQPHAWEARHWFSSSLSDEQAHRIRGAVCRSAASEPDAGTSAWLRRLHASHDAGQGPFGLCVHREDVESLSYTEVSSMPKGFRVAHFIGSPCKMELDSFKTLELARITPRTGSDSGLA